VRGVRVAADRGRGGAGIDSRGRHPPRPDQQTLRHDAGGCAPLALRLIRARTGIRGLLTLSVLGASGIASLLVVESHLKAGDGGLPHDPAPLARAWCGGPQVEVKGPRDRLAERLLKSKEHQLDPCDQYHLSNLKIYQNSN
jgi:hypothetical protein